MNIHAILSVLLLSASLLLCTARIAHGADAGAPDAAPVTAEIEISAAAPAAPSINPEAVSVAVDTADPTDLVGQVAQAFLDRDWRTLFAALLMLTVSVVRRFSLMQYLEERIGKHGPFVTGLLLSAIATVSLGLYAGYGTVQIVSHTVGLWLMGMGTHSVWKRVQDVRHRKKTDQNAPTEEVPLPPPGT